MQFLVQHGKDKGAVYDLSGLSDTQRSVFIRQNTPANAQGLGAAGDSEDGINWSTFLSTLPQQAAAAWTAFTQAQLQSQLLELNIQRAGQGLPMVKMPGISVGADANTLLVIGGIGLAVALAIFGGKRRR